MSLLSWVGRTIGLGNRDRPFWNLFFGSGSYKGRHVSLEDSLKLSAWWACVRLWSQIVAALPQQFFRENADGQRELVRDHPLLQLFRVSPNAEQTAVEFWEGMIAGLLTIGNAYAEKQEILGRLVALMPIPWELCRPYRDENGAVRYRWTVDGKERNLPAESVLHLRGFGFGGLMGLSPLAYAHQTLSGAMDTEEASARLFGTGMRASGFLMSPQTLDVEQRRHAQKNLIKPLEGPQAEGKIGLLEGGWKFQAANVPAKDAEMLLSRRFNVEDICRFMGTPPILIGHAGEGQTMWGSGVEQIMLGWLTTQLGPFLTRIEAALNRHVIPVSERGRVFVDYDESALLRADSAARATLMASLAQNGLRTRNELRRLDNLGPLPGGDVLTVQSNLTLLSRLGETPAAPTPDQSAPQDPADPKREKVVPA